jgi:hypothetical protein
MKETLLNLKSIIFWDMTQCSLFKVNQHFGGTYRLNLRIEEYAEQEPSVKASGR